MMKRIFVYIVLYAFAHHAAAGEKPKMPQQFGATLQSYYYICMLEMDTVRLRGEPTKLTACIEKYKVDAKLDYSRFKASVAGNGAAATSGKKLYVEFVTRIDELPQLLGLPGAVATATETTAQRDLDRLAVLLQTDLE